MPQDNAERLAKEVGTILLARKWHIACAESCTGGLVTNRLTDIPGSSDYVRGSVVCYTNAIKRDVVGVRQETLDTFGAVSRETAEEMAVGIRHIMDTEVGLSITGNAGPGASEGKPVGLVYIGVATPDGVWVLEKHFSGSRKEIKQQSAEGVLQLFLEGAGQGSDVS